MTSHKVSGLVGLLGIHLLGCGDSGGATTSGGGGKSVLHHARVLTCIYKDENGGNPDPTWNYTKRFCITAGLCTAAPSVYCAYNIDGTEGTHNKYDPNPAAGEGYADWGEWCDETCPSDANGDVFAGKVAYPSCGAAEPEPYPYQGVCPIEEDVTTPTTGSDESGDSSSGGDTGDTDGPIIETWICSEVAENNCQTRSNLDPSCWAQDTSPSSSPCVTAATRAEALAACQCLCDDFDDQAADGCFGSCTVLSNLDCELTAVGEGPVPLYQSSHSCIPAEFPSSQQIVDANLECLESDLFDASISLVLHDGTNTAVTGLVGSLIYTTSGCVAGVCDFTLNALSIPFTNITGIYTLGTTTATGTYTLAGTTIQMLGSLEGRWYQSRNTIVFPSDTFWVHAEVNGITLDSMPLPYSPLKIGTDQAVGSLATTRPLSLNFTFEVPGGTASVSLTAR